MTSMADALGPQLPLVRRFARALTGTQDSGDAYVAATLEAAVKDPSVFDPELHPRVALYRAFLKIWSSAQVDASGSDGLEGGVQGADRAIGQLTPRSRQAFLLVGLEGFDRATAARVMDISEPEIDGLIADAGQEIAAQLSTRVLIIEDEPLIAMDIEDIVRTLNHDVVGVARTHTEARDMAEKEVPGLILADIQLADGSSGIDAVNELLLRMDVPVIFITAFPERLLTGERPEPAFLVAKPFQPVNLRAVISQALFFDRKAGRGV